MIIQKLTFRCISGNRYRCNQYPSIVTRDPERFRMIHEGKRRSSLKQRMAAKKEMEAKLKLEQELRDQQRLTAQRDYLRAQQQAYLNVIALKKGFQPEILFSEPKPEEPRVYSHQRVGWGDLFEW